MLYLLSLAAAGVAEISWQVFFESRSKHRRQRHLDPAAALLEGKLDVAIISCPPRNKSLRVTPMFEDELVLVVSPKHRPCCSQSSSRPKDLETETVLIYPPREESTLINKLLKPAGVEAQRVIEVPLTEAIVELAAAGTGIGFLARWAVAPAVEAGKVAIRPMGGRGFRRRWHAVTMRNQPLRHSSPSS
jgi:LysR family transcriptional regulator for metE and metH